MRCFARLVLLPLFVVDLTNAQSFGSVLAQHPNLTTFRSLVAANSQLYTGMSNVNILAPSATAFTGTSDGNLTADVPEMLRYHAISGARKASNLGGGRCDVADPAERLEVRQSRTRCVQRDQRKADRLRRACNWGCSSRRRDGERRQSGRGGYTFRWRVHSGCRQLLALPEVCSKTLTANYVNTFITLLSRTGELDEYDGMTNLTCFAPSDAAFTAYRNSLTSMTMDQIEALLYRHIYSGVFYSPGLKTGDLSTSYVEDEEDGPGWKFVVRREAATGDMYLGNAKILRSDMVLKNRVVHVLDKVLVDNGSSTTTTPTFAPSSLGLPATTVSNTAALTGALTPSSPSIATPTAHSGAHAKAGAGLVFALACLVGGVTGIFAL